MMFVTKEVTKKFRKMKKKRDTPFKKVKTL